MDTVLIILYEVLILLSGINAGMKISENKPVPACMYIACAALWGICLVLRINN